MLRLRPTVIGVSSREVEQFKERREKLRQRQSESSKYRLDNDYVLFEPQRPGKVPISNSSVAIGSTNLVAQPPSSATTGARPGDASSSALTDNFASTPASDHQNMLRPLPVRVKHVLHLERRYQDEDLSSISASHGDELGTDRQEPQSTSFDAADQDQVDLELGDQRCREDRTRPVTQSTPPATASPSSLEGSGQKVIELLGTPLDGAGLLPSATSHRSGATSHLMSRDAQEDFSRPSNADTTTASLRPTLQLDGIHDFQIYNDDLPAQYQPQTPQSLPEARHRRLVGSFTEPAFRVEIGQASTIMSAAATMTPATASRRRVHQQGRSPPGLDTPGFRGLYGGLENTDDAELYETGTRLATEGGRRLASTTWDQSTNE